MELILCVTGIVTFILGIYACLNVKKINSITDKKNQEIEQKNKELEFEKKLLKQEIADIQISLKNNQEQLNTQINEFDNILQKQQTLSRNAFINYCTLLDDDYKNKEEEYNKSVELLHTSYEKQQIINLTELEKINTELDKIKATRAAVIQAHLKEAETKEQREFYMLCIKTADIDDVNKLEKIKTTLNNPRILSMLIWSTFFQKPMTALCNNVLGTSVVTGIYKITNQENNMCYIGQAVDIATRWKNHAKCGLGIDTPSNNKLYKAMQEYGIWNFTWELLEECPSAQLNEKEKYYIELYDSYSYGYNQNKGISK